MPGYEWKLTDLKKVRKNGFKVFTTFSCGGGSSMGYKLAGYEVVGNCEIDPKINDMYVKNHHPKYNFLMGVQDLHKLEKLPDELYGIDVLDGSPPCSTFSMAGSREDAWGIEKKFREGQAKQVLSDLFFEFIELANVLKPKVIVAENVKGLLMGNAKGYVNMIKKRFDEIGYDAQLFCLNSATMGVPQRRERAFFICRRKEFDMPAVKLSFNERPIRYGEFADEDFKAFNEGTKVLERWKKRSSRDKSLGDTVARTEKGKLSGFTSSYFKKKDVPPTITAGGQLIRFDKPGTLSARDIKLISSFPLDYDFNGNDAQYVCGMSVPPLMMKGVADAIAEQMLPYAKGGLIDG